jgi:hypothetical protein
MSVPKMHRENENLQNACFLALQNEYIFNMRVIIGGVVILGKSNIFQVLVSNKNISCFPAFTWF